MNIKKGFTIIECIVVIAIIGILLMISIPSFKPTNDFVIKNRINTANKVLIEAIEYWIKDNRDVTQRPANFNSINSQGKKVFEYISNNEIYTITNLAIQTRNVSGKNVRNMIVDSSKTNYPINVSFDKGVLTLSDAKSVGANTVTFGVFELSSSGEVYGYDDKKAKNYIIETDYKEVDIK